MAPGENFRESHDDNPTPKFRLNGSKREVVFMELLPGSSCMTLFHLVSADVGILHLLTDWNTALSSKVTKLCPQTVLYRPCSHLDL